MKKLIIVFFSLIAILGVLGGCSDEKSKKVSQDNSILKPGTVWKEEIGGKWYKLKIIDETTWEYSEEMNSDPIQITVERQKNYEGLERYKVIDTAGVQEFINKPDYLFIVIPYEQKNVSKMLLLGSSKEEKRTKEQLKDYGHDLDKYKLQKTSE